MKKLFAIHPRQLLLCLAILLPGSASADLWITNFETASGALASGVWRNSTTSTDLSFPVTLTHDGAVFDEETTLDGTAPWADLPEDFFFPGSNPAIDLFNPNYDGDYVSLEVDGGVTVPVTIHFNAVIVDPVLNFTDVDVQTTLVFSTANPVKVGGTPNLVVGGDSVETSGVYVLGFEEEAAGSLQFIGTLTQLDFQIVNVGPGVDRTGFSVSTTTEPVAADMLTSWTTATHFHLSWPSVTSFTAFEYSTALAPNTWMHLPGPNPATMTEWSATFLSLGDMVFVRGVY